MEPTTLTRILLLGMALGVADGGSGILTVQATARQVERAGGPDAIFEAIAARDDLLDGFETYRLHVQGGLDGLVPGEPDPLVMRMAGTGAPVLSPSGGEGALGGLTMVLSPGHGVYYSESREVWTTQRGEHQGIVEDLWTVRFVSLWLAPMLQAAGATVLNTRQYLSTSWEETLDTQDPGFATQEGSWWSLVDEQGPQAGCTPFSSGCTATFTLVVGETGVHPVLVRHPVDPTGASTVTWTVRMQGWSQRFLLHPGGAAGTWTVLGRFPMQRGETLELQVDAQEGDASALLVSGVRVGGGQGDTLRDGTVSGVSRWQEAALYWLHPLGVPSWVTQASDTDLYSDRRSRARTAAWLGADLFVSVHTNGGGGTGTVTFVHESRPPPGSEDLAAQVQRSVVEAVRAGWDPGWTDRGVKSANMDELADARPMPSILLEVGFHDTEWDARLLRDPLFRRDVSRAIVRGVVNHVSPAAPPPPPAPRLRWVRNDGAGALRIGWEPGEDPLVPVCEDCTYLAHVGRGTRRVDAGREVSGCCEATLDGFTPGEVVLVRMAARSASGASLLSNAASVVVGEPPATVLLVDGFGVLDEAVDECVNTGDASLAHAIALRGARPGEITVDFAVADAAASLLATDVVPLVDWFTGVDARSGGCMTEGNAQALLSHLESGGALLFSGEDAAGCLLAGGTDAQRLLVTALGALPVPGVRCEDELRVTADDTRLVLGEAASAPYATWGAAGLDPLAGSEPIVLCPSGATAAVLRSPDPPRGSGVLFNVPLEAAGDDDSRAKMLSSLLPSLQAADTSPGTGEPLADPSDPSPASPPDPPPPSGGCSSGPIR